MSGDITDFYVHTVTVETFQGAGANGPVYAAGQTVTGFLDGKTALIRNIDGEQVVSQSQFSCSIPDGAKFTPDSRVTTGDGRTAQVIINNSMDVAGLLDAAGDGGEIEHAVIYLK